MRVTSVIHSLDGGGAERVMATLCSRLAERGHEVTLITLDDGKRERRDVSPRVHRERIDVMSLPQGWTSKLTNLRTRVNRLRSAISSSRPDAILSFCDRTNVLTLMATSSLKVPVVVSERSDPAQQRLSAFWEFLRGRTYRHAAAIVALTEEAADHLKPRFAVPVEVISSAVDKPALPTSRDFAQQANRILAIGRLEHEKGFDRLLDAFSQLGNRYSQWSLEILGEGACRNQLEQQVAELGLKGRVSLPGWVQPIEEKLATATMFVLPSRYEGFPSALMEAMAAGVPSLAVDCESGPRSVICDPSWALLVPNDVGSLRDGIAHLAGDVEYRERLGASGRQVADRFTWDAMTDRYERLLMRVADETN